MNRISILALAALAHAALACDSGSPSTGGAGGGGAQSSASAGTGSGASSGVGGAGCVATGFECSSPSACCGGGACMNGVCCSTIGGACTESFECCFGTACTNGQCECSKSVPFAEGCASAGDCCSVSPDHEACLEDGTGGPSGYCGFTGTITIENFVCQKVGTSGININEYCVSIGGTFAGPVGAVWDLNTDPANTINQACGPVSGCNDWKTGTCTRGADEPATTKFSWSYMFGSDQTSIDVLPWIDLEMTGAGTLDQKEVKVHCQE